MRSFIPTAKRKFWWVIAFEYVCMVFLPQKYQVHLCSRHMHVHICSHSSCFRGLQKKSHEKKEGKEERHITTKKELFIGKVQSNRLFYESFEMWIFFGLENHLMRKREKQKRRNIDYNSEMKKDMFLCWFQCYDFKMCIVFGLKRALLRGRKEERKT